MARAAAAGRMIEGEGLEASPSVSQLFHGPAPRSPRRGSPHGSAGPRRSRSNK